MSKRLRQQSIVDIVSKGTVPSQATLAQELKKLGFDVTQATLSRDIAELELVKSKEGYLRPEDASGSGPAIPDAEGTLRRLVLKVEEAMNMVVIRTPPGSAQPVAIALEDGIFNQVVGTLGGDDTCLVVTRGVEEANEFKDQLLKLIN
ncbi:MAG: ArgR family transcriptional regulator [Deltaproteobacteria bacterium]|nr:ArgR family transcriptional regulator [Deltaproteobacteria bacterium]